MPEKIETKTAVHPKRPETITEAGKGLDRRSLLAGESVRTRITTTSDGQTRHFMLIGGSDTNNGYSPGDRPPLLINEELYDGEEGLAVLPYTGRTLRDEPAGVFVGEPFVIGADEAKRDLGEVTQIDHVSAYGGGESYEDLSITQLFKPWEVVISTVTHAYQRAQARVTPPEILP